MYTETVGGISHGSVRCLYETDRIVRRRVVTFHADRPPEVEYSERLTSAKRQDEGGTEGLCSPHMELERAVIQLQRDIEDCRSELELARKWTPQRRSGVHVDSGSKILREVKLGTVLRGVRMAGTMSGRPYICYPTWTEMHSTLFCWFRSLEGWR